MILWISVATVWILRAGVVKTMLGKMEPALIYPRLNEFVAMEFQADNLRIDILTFNDETNFFVII